MRTKKIVNISEPKVNHPADRSLKALKELSEWKEQYESLWNGDTFLERGLRTAYLTVFARMEKLAQIYGAET